MFYKTTRRLKYAFRVLPLIYLAANPSSHGQQATADPFPMEEGTTWVYRGVVRWYDMQAQKRVERTVTSRSEVIRVIRRKGLVATLITGFPADYDWSDGSALRHGLLFVRTEGDKLYWFTEDVTISEKSKRLGNSQDSLQGALTEDDLLMKLPLKKGMKFCDEEAKARTDDMYCWVVASDREVALNGVKGLQSGKRTAFLLQYVTNPDDTEMEFVPGIGFISYRYHHHGTVADTEMNLIEYHAPGGVPASPRAKK